MKPTYTRRRTRRPASREAATFKKDNQQEQAFFGDAGHEPFFKPSVPAQQTPAVQRKCDGCEKEEKAQRKAGEKEEEKVQRMPEKEEEKVQRAVNKEEEKIQRAPEKKEEDKVQKKETATSAAPAHTAANYISAINGKGQNLSPDVQSFYEGRIGADFSDVKIHTGQEAAQSAKDINAQAYAYGNHIVFNEGKYQPETSEGKHLLAHELAHVVQQRGGKKVNPKIQRRIGDGHDFPAGSPFALNAILESVFDNTATVSASRNNNGTHVTLIQNALIGRGYELPRFGADGNFGDETRRAVRAFQQDVGLGADGVVGFRTIDFLDKRSRGVEVAPPAAAVVANTPFNRANAIVQPGAAPSNALRPLDWGLTFPENVQVSIDVINTGAVWQPVLRGITGNYSIQNRLLPATTEVTGPGGNTNAGNYCAQITDLDSLAPGPVTWYMRSAVLGHERVHAEKFRTALIHASVAGALETAIEAITVPVGLLTPNAFFAEVFIRMNPAFAAALTAAQANWLTRILALVGGDHGPGGLSLRAEREIVNPMIRRICRHARANGWASCPPLCR